MTKFCPSCGTVLSEFDIFMVMGIEIWVCQFPGCKKKWIDTLNGMEEYDEEELDTECN